MYDPGMPYPRHYFHCPRELGNNIDLHNLDCKHFLQLTATPWVECKDGVAYTYNPSKGAYPSVIQLCPYFLNQAMTTSQKTPELKFLNGFSVSLAQRLQYKVAEKLARGRWDLAPVDYLSDHLFDKVLIHEVNCSRR